MKNYYSTTEVARLLDMNRYTVSLWIDRGTLKALVTPGGHKKVPREEVLRFIRSRGGRPPSDLQPETRVHVVVMHHNADFCHMLRNGISQAAPGATVSLFQDAIGALIAAGAHNPGAIVWELKQNDPGGLEIIRRIRGHERTRRARIIIVADDNQTLRDAALAQGADCVVSSNTPYETLLNHIKNLLSTAPERPAAAAAKV